MQSDQANSLELFGQLIYELQINQRVKLKNQISVTTELAIGDVARILATDKLKLDLIELRPQFIYFFNLRNSIVNKTSNIDGYVATLCINSK